MTKDPVVNQLTLLNLGGSIEWSVASGLAGSEPRTEAFKRGCRSF